MPFDFGGKPKARGKGKPKFMGADDPLADVEYTGDLAKDAAAELTALERGWRERRDQEQKRFIAATDTEYWFAVAFRTRAHKDAFLAAMELTRLGDKYIDGHALARALGVTLPD